MAVLHSQWGFGGGLAGAASALARPGVARVATVGADHFSSVCQQRILRGGWPLANLSPVKIPCAKETAADDICDWCVGQRRVSDR